MSMPPLPPPFVSPALAAVRPPSRAGLSSVQRRCRLAFTILHPLCCLPFLLAAVLAAMLGAIFGYTGAGALGLVATAVLGGVVVSQAVGLVLLWSAHRAGWWLAFVFYALMFLWSVWSLASGDGGLVGLVASVVMGALLLPLRPARRS